MVCHSNAREQVLFMIFPAFTVVYEFTVKVQCVIRPGASAIRIRDNVMLSQHVYGD